MTIYNGKLVVGGVFTTAGGVTCNQIAQWDGSSWTPLGTGMDGNEVEYLTTYNGNLIACGKMVTAGGVTVDDICMWDGSAWHNLGSGTGCSGCVYAACEYNGELYAGGNFSTMGGNACCLAAWNGTSWRAISTNSALWSNARDLAMSVLNGQLFIGGSYLRAGGKIVDKLYSWNGQYINPVIYGCDKEIYQLLSVGNSLYIAGSQTYLDGINCNNFCVDTSEHSPVSIMPISSNVPGRFNLFQNYPDPFNPTTTIRFDIPKDANITLQIFDVLGKLVATIANYEFRKAGSYKVVWDANNFASGVYFYKIIAGQFIESKKMVVLK